MKHPNTKTTLALVCAFAFSVLSHAQTINKAVEKESATGNLTASFNTGNKTLTVSSGGTLSAVAGSTVTLAGTTTISGNSTLGNATLTGNLTLTGNNNTVSPTRTIDLGTGPSSDGYFYPLKWGSGSRYTLGGGVSTFQSVADHLGNIAYNQAQVAGDVTFGLGFEARYQNAPQGTDTEHYYFWNGPVGVSADSGGRTSRRIHQTNISWGTAYSAPVTKPMGWAQIGFDVNKFSVDNGSNFNGEFSIDFGSSPKLLTWQNAMSLGGALAISGAITQSGTNANTLYQTTVTAGNASYIFPAGNSSALTVASESGDAGLKLLRTGVAGSEFVAIGAAAGGTLFGGASNAYYFDTNSSSAGTLRLLGFRYSSNSGSSYASALTLDHPNLTATIGYTTEASAGSGAFKVLGGANIAKKLIVESTTASTSATTGSATFGGGIGVSGAVYASGIGVFGGGLNITGTSSVNSANTAVIDFFGGFVEYISLGANASTNGGHQFISRRSDGSNSITSLQLSSAGVASFSNTTEATTGGTAAATFAGGIYAAKKLVTSGDVEVADIGEGIIIKSPNGTRWRITVSDAGAFVATSL